MSFLSSSAEVGEVGDVASAESGDAASPARAAAAAAAAFFLGGMRAGSGYSHVPYDHTGLND